jgi:hypothetical protein
LSQQALLSPFPPWDALCDPSVDLTFYKHGIDLSTAVIDRDHAGQGGLTGLFVDLDGADIRAKGNDIRFSSPHQVYIIFVIK